MAWRRESLQNRLSQSPEHCDSSVTRGDIPLTDEDSLSPRSELLSEDSPPDGYVAPQYQRKSPSRGPGERHRRERERAHSRATPQELLRLLVNKEYEATELRKALRAAMGRLQSVERHNTEITGETQEIARRFKALNDSRITAQQEASRAKQELLLYKHQLETAQNEITRAQHVLQAIEKQRTEAEASASRARARIRQLNEARVVDAAREEGRRLGFEAGFRRGQMGESGKSGPEQAAQNSPGNQNYTDPLYYDDDGLEEEVLDESRSSRGGYSPPPLQHPQVVRVSDTQPTPRPAPQYAPPSVPPPGPPPPPITEPVADVPRPHTPSVQVYSIDIPPAEQIEQQFNTNDPPSGRPRVKPRGGRERTPSPRRPPPDNYMPLASSNGAILLPPPHEFDGQHQSPAPTVPITLPDNTAESESISGRQRWDGRGSANDYYRGVGTSFQGTGDTHSQPQARYQNSAQSRDYPYPAVRRNSAGSGSASTSFSQYEIVSPPESSTPNGGTGLGRHGKEAYAGRKVRDKESQLSMIKENPLSRQASPAVERFGHRGSRSMDVGGPSGMHPFVPPEINELGRRDLQQKMADHLRYSDPQAAEERVGSGASIGAVSFMVAILIRWAGR